MSAYDEDNLRTTVVYRAVNKINGHDYIGITRNGLKRRKSEHIKAAKRGCNGRLYDGMRKHGVDAFDFYVMETCHSYEAALAREVALIATWKPYYNVAKGGRGAIGYRHTDEFKRNMSARLRGKSTHWLKGKPLSEEHKAKIRATKAANPHPHPMQGKKQPREAVEKRRLSLLGTKWKNRPTEEMKAVWRASSAKGAARCRKRVICHNDGNVYASATEAARAYGLCRHSVSAVCNPNRKTCKSTHGYRFSYAGNP